MKKLFTILWILFTAFGTAFATADEILINLTPSEQYAISWSDVEFSISISGAVSQNSKIQFELPEELKFVSATIPPRNLLQVQNGEQPYWLINSWTTFQAVVTTREVAQEFLPLTVIAKLIEWDSGVATWVVNPISDVEIKKIMSGPSPKVTWDTVLFEILVKNVGSARAENVKVIDVWPSNVLTFSNYWILNWTQVIPYIYNGISNQYEFAIWNINPGQEMVLKISGTMDTLFPVGTEFVNSAFIVMDWNQFFTWNDNSLASWTVLWFPNVHISAQKLSVDPSFNGDAMIYKISYGNNGQDVANDASVVVDLPNIMVMDTTSLTWFTQVSANTYKWNLDKLNVWANWTLVITWHMATNSPAGTEFTFKSTISTVDEQLTTTDDVAVLTGKINSYFSWSMSSVVTNLTRPEMNDSATKIRAVSGDEVKLEITLINSGNIVQNWNLVVSHGNENRYFQEVSLVPWRPTTYRFTKVVWPKNFQTISPNIRFVYGDSQTISTSVTINEPLSCGDGLITQNEVCDTASSEWLLPWQHCANNCMSIVTDTIVNTACIEYCSESWCGKICDDAVVHYGEQDYKCESISSPWSIVELDENDKWKMRFTCKTSNGYVANSIKIDCGNGRIGETQNASSFAYTCNYTYDEQLSNNYTVACYIDGETTTNPACKKKIGLGYGFYGVCGNGIIEDGEECDFSFLSRGRPYTIGNWLNDVAPRISSDKYKWDICKNCKIIKNGNFVYEPAQCLYTDTPISVMNNEIMPFWRRLWISDTQRVVDEWACRKGYEWRTLLLDDEDDKMMCYFGVYNGTHTQWEQAIQTFKQECFNTNFDDYKIYDYFKDSHRTTSDGANISSINALTDGNGMQEYGEYKLVLEKVEYKYCDTNDWSWKKWERFGAVCEVDFAITRPYMMQISTFGVNPIATNNKKFLDDFLDMAGKQLLDKTDLSSTINIDNNDYAVETDVKSKFDEFKNKYEKLAVELKTDFKINGKTLKAIFGSNITQVKKVPNQSIYFIKWKGTLVLKQENIQNFTSAYTIVVEWMDVEIEWNVLQYAMVVTDKKMSFKDAWEDSKKRCVKWWQVVQWIYVALSWFNAGELLRNTDENEYRCAWGWLHVKWVLIWDGIENVMNSRRSQLNSRFTVTNTSTQAVLRQRRQKIIEWAAVLIEYSPDLWKTLPPWAEIFTESLEVYRR